MRKIVSSTFLTLDGVMQAPGGPDEDPSSGFKWGGWSFNYWDDEADRATTELFSSHPDLLLGRKTYDIFAAFWPTASAEQGADNLNKARKYVVSRTLDRVTWENSTLVKGDAVAEIQKLKELDGPELQVHGSGNLLQTLLRHRLVDELQLIIFPVTIGEGKRLFGEGTIPGDYKIVSGRVSASGVIIARYALGGELKLGSFA